MIGSIETEQARAFVAASRFHWHQQFELAPDVRTPGVSNVDFLLDRAGVPADLSGLSVLDIGTTNGGAAFEAERRGAARVVAVDIYPPDRFGFSALRDLCDSRVEFVQASVYDLPERLHEQFDLVLFFGVLYHLRHPLLALDKVWELTRSRLAIETAVCDYETLAAQQGAYVRFYRTSELANDASNWFAPSVIALHDWVRSAGFAVTQSSAWPEPSPQRAMVCAERKPAPPEYLVLSYERPLTVTVG